MPIITAIIFAALLTTLGVILMLNVDISMIISAFTPSTLLFVGYVPFMVLGLYITYKAIKHLRITRGEWTLLVVSFVTSVFCCFLIWLYTKIPEEQSIHFILSCISLLIAWFATLGWTTTNYLNFINQRKNHTMQVLMLQKESEVFHIHSRNINKYFNLRNEISIEEWETIQEDKNSDDQDTAELAMDKYTSVIYMLNYFEFISLGINNGDLDSSMMRKSYRAVMKTFYYFSKNVIQIKVEDNFGQRNDLIYKEYRKILKNYGVDL